MQQLLFRAKSLCVNSAAISGRVFYCIECNGPYKVLVVLKLV